MSTVKNIAIIAHVDHGKTTLVDKIMFHCQLFRDNQNRGELILDNNDLERERGITILSKNVSVNYKGVKINIIGSRKNLPIKILEIFNTIENLSSNNKNLNLNIAFNYGFKDEIKNIFKKIIDKNISINPKVAKTWSK